MTQTNAFFNNNKCEDDDDSDIVNNSVKEQRLDTPKQGVKLKSLIRTVQDAFRKIPCQLNI